MFRFCTSPSHALHASSPTERAVVLALREPSSAQYINFIVRICYFLSAQVGLFCQKTYFAPSEAEGEQSRRQRTTEGIARQLVVTRPTAKLAYGYEQNAFGLETTACCAIKPFELQRWLCSPSASLGAHALVRRKNETSHALKNMARWG